MPYGGSQFNYGMSQILSTLDENLTKVVGKHQLRSAAVTVMNGSATFPTGRRTRSLSPTWQPPFTTRPPAPITAPSPIPATPDADFFLGAADSYSQVKNAPFGHYREQEIDSYIQDNYRVSQHLTINPGCAGRCIPRRTPTTNNFVTFDLKNDALVLPSPLSYYIQNGFTTQAIVTNLQNLGVKFETPQQAGIPSSGINNSMANFNPAAGLCLHSSVR